MVGKWPRVRGFAPYPGQPVASYPGPSVAPSPLRAHIAWYEDTFMAPGIPRTADLVSLTFFIARLVG